MSWSSRGDPPSSRDRDPTGAPILAPRPGLPAEPVPEPASPDQLPGEAAERPKAHGAPTQLPPDPEAYDSPRAVQARARGLAAPYIAGGTDPDPERGRREERRLAILLVAMIAIVVSLGFVLGIIQNLFRL